MKLRNHDEINEFIVKTYPSLERSNNTFFYNKLAVFILYYNEIGFYTPMLAKEYGIVCKKSCEVKIPVEESFLREKINKYFKNYLNCEKQVKHHREMKLLQEIKGDF